MAKGDLGEEGMPGEGRKMECQAMGKGNRNEACITKNRLRGVFHQLPIGANGSGFETKLKEFLSLLLV